MDQEHEDYTDVDLPPPLRFTSLDAIFGILGALLLVAMMALLLFLAWRMGTTSAPSSSKVIAITKSSHRILPSVEDIAKVEVIGQVKPVVLRPDAR